MNKKQLLETLGVMRDKLMEQGEQSIVTRPFATPMCQYRGDRGLKCAIGHVLADEDYNKSLEDRSVNSIYRIKNQSMKLNGYKVNDKNIKWLMIAQEIHDRKRYLGGAIWMNIKDCFKQSIEREFNELIDECKTYKKTYD